MQLFLDLDDQRSMTTQLYEQVRDAIAEGQLSAGARLQPTRAVAREWWLFLLEVGGERHALTA